jgi:hypothetical protein
LQGNRPGRPLSCNILISNRYTSAVSGLVRLFFSIDYVDGWVEGCLERIGEDYPEEELLFRDLWEDETQRDVVIESLQADCEVRTGRTPGL